MFDTMGFGVYFFFASLMLCSVVFVFFLMPETKGVPLESMDRLFDYKPPRRAHKAILSELRVEDEDFRRHSTFHKEDFASRRASAVGYQNGDSKETGSHVEAV